MRLIACCLVAAAALAFAVPSATEAREPISPAALATLSGVDKALDEAAATIADEGEKLARSGEEMGEPARFVQAWRTAARDAFAAEKLKASLARRLTGKLNAAESNAVEDFYRSPLGARIVAAEVASGTQAGQQQMIAEAEKVMTALEKDAARKRLVEGIGEAVRHQGCHGVDGDERFARHDDRYGVGFRQRFGREDDARRHRSGDGAAEG